MRLLQDILYTVRIDEVIGATHVAVEQLALDSREVRNFTLFAALSGSRVNGHEYIEQAISKGANCILCEQLPSVIHSEVTYVKTPDSAEALGIIASNFYGGPSDKIKVIGVTGTNGKTTVATLMYEITRSLGRKAGLLSTVVNKIDGKSIPSTHTTPNSIELQRLLSEMVEQGCEFAFMEVSSHALDQRRVSGLKFTGALFTNITHDHLDYHGSFNAYIRAKKMLFDSLGSRAFALVNGDDRHAEVMVQNCKGKINFYALQSMADYRAKILENSLLGLTLVIDQHELCTPLIGEFNAYNVLAVYSGLVQLGLSKLDVLTAISTQNAPEGRFQPYRSKDGVYAVVDYAHTPDALENVLRTIQAIRSGNERLICVMGCGGDRDRAKRPIMGRISAENADLVIVTSDNPRSEDPKMIIGEIVSELDPVLLKKTITITDRSEAIATVSRIAENGDIILIAGKGHEKYQEIQGVKYPFDDYQMIVDQLKLRTV
jgi:UDP-N-acetylmuramoyl-L-alanyl-D-glutamate--2,6-diaminopimelate ligase